VRAQDIERVQALVDRVNGTAVYQVVSGGQERQASVWAGLKAAIRPFVAVHDAARPLLQAADLDAVVTAARESGAAALGHPARDSMLRVNTGGQIADVVSRETVWQVQTPQVARRDWLVAAHEEARAQRRAATDDTALLRAAGYPVMVVRGSAWNVKVTEAEDVHYVLERLLREEM
ncbi:MAG: 2-C-methyl-D-erythritol 4-phosphate cytidylyltransferase, partial [Firmicutes bacterium]|nr:2-C-methyl-D-erythritol 4-phosphate cytidylyltransferase [Bacillota bacterium]